MSRTPLAPPGEQQEAVAKGAVDPGISKLPGGRPADAVLHELHPDHQAMAADVAYQSNSPAIARSCSMRWAPTTRALST